jgi:tetratricopeptide (TPR) repeat protein
MAKWNWKQCKEDFVLFIEAGFIAVNQADEDSALKLFKAAEALDPSNALPKVGLGYLHLHLLDLKKACKLLEEALEMEPGNDMARAMLGISMSFDPTMTSKAEKILEKTCCSNNKTVKDLSGSALTFIDKFIKNEPSPVEGQRKKK